jgi:hypothetical protein
LKRERRLSAAGFMPGDEGFLIGFLRLSCAARLIAKTKRQAELDERVRDLFLLSPAAVRNTPDRG